MALSGRFVLLLVAGAVPTIILNSPAVLLIWVSGVIALGIADAAVAGSPRSVAVSRTLPAQVRLGESVASVLTLRNAGRRRIRGVVRDGWQPSAGATAGGTP